MSGASVSSPVIDETLARRLIAAQFPQWSDLAVRRIEAAGWDNCVFRLGDELVIRLPSAAEYAVQVDKQHRWLPMLAPSLPLEIPTPVAIGGPVEGYLWRWSVYRWIEGEVATPERIVDLNDFARELAQFIGDLQRIDTTDGPRPGAHNFHRGGSLRIYDAQTRQAIAILQGKIDSLRATEIWNAALATTWGRSPVWIHGDVSRGNLLVRRGRLSAVIDFGLLAVGDPACDLSIAWTLFSDRSRDAFRSMLPLDSGTWKRAKGWTLWKALIAAAGLNETNAIEGQQCWRTVGEVLQDPLFD